MVFKREPVTRVFYASDIHGSERMMNKFLNAGAAYRVQILVMGGDLTGKALVPLVRRDGGHTCSFMGRELAASTPAELEELKKLVNHNGLYARSMDADEITRLETDDAYREQILREVLTESITRCLQKATDKLKGSGIRCYVMPGNDDPSLVADLLGGCDAVCNPEGLRVELDEHHEMISLGYSNPTPWNTERELPEEELLQRMEAMMSGVQRPEQLVVNFHAPPHGSGLDNAPELTPDLKVQTSMGQPLLAPVGSTATRRFIETHQPLLGLHGHIHESPGVTKLGRTLCINPGSAYSEGVLTGTIVALKTGGIASYQMVRG
jgi:Icc-related predicted phosphoesterase